jgi:secreted trypsin-like serine protease
MPRDSGGRTVSEGRFRHRGRWYVLALVAALVLGAVAAVAAVPAFAAAEEKAFEARVVGGKPVPDGKYPFMAALEERSRDEGGQPSPFQQYCGGSLIDRNHVITAAHCVEFIGGGPGGLPLRDFRVVIGRTVLGSDQGQVRRVEGLQDISIHARYAPRVSSAYDVAVIGLDRPVGGIEPIKLATARQDFLEQPGRLATVTGWGNTTSQPPFGGAGEDFPRRLREAEVPLVSDAEGREDYGRVYQQAAMIAAGKKGKDTCQGDSGGPMFDRVSGQYRQIGITNFGYGCATKRFPGVYAEVNAPRVHNFIEWATAR